MRRCGLLGPAELQQVARAGHWLNSVVAWSGVGGAGTPTFCFLATKTRLLLRGANQRFQPAVRILTMRSDADLTASGDRWAYLTVIVMVRWPASSWISLREAPANACQEQKV